MIQKLREKTDQLLRKSEKYTKTDMVYISRGWFWLSWGHIISSTMGLLLLIAFANLLPAETYGTYKFVLNIASILTIFTLGGLTNSITQSVARGYEGSIEEATRTRITWGVIGLVAGLLISLYYLLNDNILLAIALIIVALTIPFLESFGLYESFLQGKKLFKESIFKFSITRIVTSILMIITIWHTDNLLIVLLAYFLPLSAARFYFYKKTLKKHELNDQVDKSTISYGKHLSFMAAMGKIATYLDSILVFHFLGPIQVAVYAFALAPIEQVTALYKNIPLLSIPKLSNQSARRINALLKFRMTKLFILGIIIAITYVFVAPFAFELVFPQYMNAVIFTQVLAVTLALRLPLSFLSSVIQSRLDVTPKSWLYWRLIAPIALIISLLVLTPVYGMWGVVISKIFFVLVSFCVNWIQWKLFLKREITIA